mmetsp:Transcript_1770/g.7301  ORF Transcript_1770/g.7301 Transcript_1770/m.7301 type:complete len:363 (-) Transcript_1770:619-1707(-)
MPPKVLASFFICAASSFLMRCSSARPSRCVSSPSRSLRTSRRASSYSSVSTNACARRYRAFSFPASRSSAFPADSEASFQFLSFSATAAPFRYRLSLIFFVSFFSSSEKLWSCSTKRSALSYLRFASSSLPALYASLPAAFVASPISTRSPLVMDHTSFSFSKEVRVTASVTASAPPAALANAPAQSAGTRASAVSPCFMSITHSSRPDAVASSPVLKVSASAGPPSAETDTTHVAPSLGRSQPSPSVTVFLVPRPSQMASTTQSFLSVTTTSAACGGAAAAPAGTPSRYCVPPGTFFILYRTDSPSFIFRSTERRPTKGASFTANVASVSVTIASPAPATSSSGAVIAYATVTSSASFGKP